MRISRLKVPLFILLLLLGGNVFAQDSSRVIIVSQRVGAAIDKGEAAYFHLFTNVPLFDTAVVLRQSNGVYTIRFTGMNAGTTNRDTLIEIPEDSLMMLAEKINYFEEIIKGKYKTGSKADTLWYEAGGTIIYTPSVKTKLQTHKNEALPFTYNKNGLHIEEYHQVGFGVGVSSFQTNLEDLDRAYTAIEDGYRSQGYTIHKHNQFSYPIIFWVNGQFRVTPRLSLVLGVGSSVTSIQDYKIVTLSCTYSLLPYQTRSYWYPYLSIGVGKYHRTTSEDYNDNVGNYDYLRLITFEERNWGFPISGTVEYHPSPLITYAFTATYHYVLATAPPMPITGLTSTHLSALSLGGRIFFCLW